MSWLIIQKSPVLCCLQQAICISSISDLLMDSALFADSPAAPDPRLPSPRPNARYTSVASKIAETEKIGNFMKFYLFFYWAIPLEIGRLHSCCKHTAIWLYTLTICCLHCFANSVELEIETTFGIHLSPTFTENKWRRFWTPGLAQGNGMPSVITSFGEKMLQSILGMLPSAIYWFDLLQNALL